MRKRQRPTKRKLLSFEFRNRARRALLWKKATYELWFLFAKVHQRSGGKIPKQFGDLSKFTFEEWWRHEKYGFELFCEPEHEDLVQVADGRTKSEDDSVLLKVKMNADSELILRDFETMLNRLQTHNEYQSMAKFQPSLPQQQIKLKKLEEALTAYLASETMIHRRAIRRLYKMRPAEYPKFERVLTQVHMDSKYAKSQRTRNDKKQRNRRLEKHTSFGSGLAGGFSYDIRKGEDFEIWTVSQRRLKRVTNPMYENWVVKKTRLLSRQRKMVKAAFSNIENGTFP